MKISFFKIIFALVLFVSPFIVSAQSAEQNMSGFAWSSNIGWISFNNTNTGDTVDYGVHKATDGRLCGNDTCSVPGYAWSSNIGWIKFGGLGTSPTGGASDAIVDSLGAVTGWARACAGTVNGDCTGASRTDGWDGWISLSGATPNYGITQSGNNFIGYAWGSDVVGWVSFDVAGENGVVTGFNFNLTGTEVTIAQGTPSAPAIILSKLVTGTPSSSGYFDGWLSTPPSSSRTLDAGFLSSPYCIPSNPPNHCLLPTTEGSDIHFTLNGLGGLPQGTYLVHVKQSVNDVNAVSLAKEAQFNLIVNSGADSCGTYSGTTPRLTEPATPPTACNNPDAYINFPADITTNGSQAWRWSCGTVTTCTAPKFGCYTRNYDSSYNPNGPHNDAGCSNICAINPTYVYPACTGVGGDANSCSTPPALPVHYLCGDGSQSPTNTRSSGPIGWTWMCGGNTCHESQSPGYREPGN